MASNLTSAGFGAWLREEREKRGMTALALAEKSGYSHVTIHNIEHGKKGVRRDTVRAIVQALCGEDISEESAALLLRDALLEAGFAPEPEIERITDANYAGGRYSGEAIREIRRHEDLEEVLDNTITTLLRQAQRRAEKERSIGGTGEPKTKG